MAEKKRVNLAKIDISTEDFEWLNINMKFKVEEIAKALEMVVGPLGIPGKIPCGREKFLKAVKAAWPPIITKESLMMFAKKAPLQDLKAIVRDLTASLKSRKKAE